MIPVPKKLNGRPVLGNRQERRLKALDFCLMEMKQGTKFWKPSSRPHRLGRTDVSPVLPSLADFPLPTRRFGVTVQHLRVEHCANLAHYSHQRLTSRLSTFVG